MTETYILIDGSYYIFYRLFALVNWWKLSHKDEPITNLEENPEFVQKFKNLIQDKLKEIPKKIGIPKKTHVKYIIGQDCKRENIWRNNLYSQYKGTRGDYSDAKVNPGPFFKIVYQEQLFQNITNLDINVIRNSSLEADDCLAIASKYLIHQNPQNKVYIITSDTDYLQLIQSNISLYNLKYKPVNTEKNSLGCPKKDLLYKIIIGDKSDNIPSVFQKCGPKKTLNYVNDVETFESDLIKYNAFEQYKLNRRLIDFTQIPELLKEDVIEQLDNILTQYDDSH
jgi:5'-3' exonuclease